MISISSAFPVLPAQDSLYYELLALTAICGEVPCACADRLTSSKSYRKKVVTSLTHDKLLRIFSKDHLRGYRLGIRGKRLLRERAPERFQFYLSGRTDTNSIKSSPARRLRLHRIAQTYVTMLNAGTMIYRDEKPPVFVPGGSSPCRIEAPVFYDSREMKELGLEMVKVHGSRMAGSLLTPSRTFAVFNGMDAVPVFDTQIEQRGKIMLQNIRYTRNGVSHTPDGILLSDQWAVMTTLLEDAKTYKKEHFLFGEGYEHFYFLTNDYHGETLLWLLCHPDIIGQLNAMLLRELQPPCRNAYILSASLGGIEQTDSGKTIAVVDYNGFRIVIPLKEMMVAPSAANSTDSMAVRQMKLLGNMLGAEIDFVILGIDSKSRSVVASRREAMMRKRQLFYFSPDANGEYRVREGRVVQARVIAVADKSIRVEIFGVECSIMARDLAWDWIGDAHDRFAVGDQILVRVTEVNKTSQEELSVHADVKSVTENTSHEALKRCRVQSKYAGRVTDVHKGIVYVRLSNGVNAVAHSCYDRRTPGKKDDVSFVVTKLDEERSIAVGIITRIIRQNL